MNQVVVYGKLKCYFKFNFCSIVMEYSDNGDLF